MREFGTDPLEARECMDPCEESLKILLVDLLVVSAVFVGELGAVCDVCAVEGKVCFFLVDLGELKWQGRGRRVLRYELRTLSRGLFGTGYSYQE